MPLSRLYIRHCRNLEEVSLTLHPRVNLFYGENGAGKTSVLEAVSLLARGRSFRSHKLKPLIQSGVDAVLVHGALEETGQRHKLGVERNRRSQDLFRLDGETVASAADLAKVLPVQTIFADTFQLVTGSPGDRRQFLDWLVFHVEPGFFQAWQQVRQALKQRNTLLRSGRISPDLLAPWDQLLATQAMQLDDCRDRVFRQLQQAFDGLKATVEALGSVEIEYFRGWSPESSLADLLVQGRERDCQSGFTQVGPHRADLRIRVNRASAQEYLSRGQLKILACALKIAAGQVFQAQTQRPCVYLLDDLPAELDREHRFRLANWLADLDSQLLVTGIDPQALAEPWSELKVDYRMFHVEQGRVVESANNDNV